jgi:hypothetical protein
MEGMSRMLVLFSFHMLARLLTLSWPPSMGRWRRSCGRCVFSLLAAGEGGRREGCKGVVQGAVSGQGHLVNRGQGGGQRGGGGGWGVG